MRRVPTIVMRRRRTRAGALKANRLTLGLALVAGAAVVAVAAGELARVWSKGSAPPPSSADDPLQAAAEAVVETAEVALAGYHDVSRHEQSMFNLMSSFVVTFITARAITTLLRRRPTVGPFRDLKVGRRHIHHFVPGIVLAFASGAAAIVTRDEDLEPRLAVPFGVGMGLTLDESALLLELDDVYWSEEGVVSVQIALSVTALLSALVLGMRFLRRGERVVLEDGTGDGAQPGLAEPAGRLAGG